MDREEREDAEQKPSQEQAGHRDAEHDVVWQRRLKVAWDGECPGSMEPPQDREVR